MLSSLLPAFIRKALIKMNVTSSPNVVAYSKLLKDVHGLESREDVVVWSSDSGNEQANVSELLFILGTSPQGTNTTAKSTHYVAAILKEQPDNADRPFRLLLLKTATIPDQLQRHVITQLPPHLVTTGNSNSIDVIVSTKSGINLSLAFWETVLQPLWDVAADELSALHSEDDGAASQSETERIGGRSVLVTQHTDSVRDFARSLRASPPLPEIATPTEPQPASTQSRTIVLLSGDGGVVDLLNAFTPQPGQGKPRLALLPLGTGNALFHSLHKPVYGEEKGVSPLVAGLRTLFAGRAADLPVFVARFSQGSHTVKYESGSGADAERGANTADAVVGAADEEDAAAASRLRRQEAAVEKLYGAVVASYGFHASIVYESDTPEYRVHGSKRFGMVAQELLKEGHPYLAKVEVRRRASDVDWEAVSTPSEGHAYVLSTVLSNLERTFTISPASRPLDGKLRIVQFGDVGGQRTMEVMMKAYDEGGHVGMKWEDGHEVRYEEVGELRVTTLEEDERWRKVCIDGTIVEIPRGGSMSVQMEEDSPFQVVVDARVLGPDHVC